MKLLSTARVSVPLLALVVVGAGAVAVGCTGDDPAASCDSCGKPENDASAADGGSGFEIASGASITLVQGASVQVDIGVTRAGFEGPITATASALPDGVTATALVINAGSTGAKLTLTALPNAKQGSTPITISTSDADGKIRRERPATLLVRGPAGSADTTFGTMGKVLANFGATGIAVRGAVVQSDGRLLVGGRSDNDFVVARLDVNGAIDASYNGTGKATVDLRVDNMASQDIAEGIAIAPVTGEVVLGGYRTNMTSTYGIARLTPAGKLDTTFNQVGYATPSFPEPWLGDPQFFAVAVQSDKKPVLAGTILEPGGKDNAVIARFKDNGAPDETFGNAQSGFFYTSVFRGADLATRTNDRAEALAVTTDDKIIAAGTTETEGPPLVQRMFALKLGTDGQLDPTFGAGGKTQIPFAASASAHSVHVLADGHVILTGESATKIVIARLDATGQMDTSFAGTGKVTLDLGANAVTEPRSIVDASGRIVIAAATGPDNDVVLARVTTDGKLDTSFTATGYLVAKIGAKAASGNVRIARAPDGRIVVATNLEAAPVQLVAFRFWD
jgi:uncharacterized delta-60 repeat protein